METVDTFDIKKAILDSIAEVFDAMLSMEIEYVDQVAQSYLYGERILGSVNLVGEIMGIVNIQMDRDCSREMTCAMLGIKDDEIEGIDDIKDVIGEVCNMVGGKLKSDLCDAGHNCVLSPPSFTTGSDFEMKFLRLSRREAFAYCCDGEMVKILIGLEPGEN